MFRWEAMRRHVWGLGLALIWCVWLSSLSSSRVWAQEKPAEAPKEAAAPAAESGATGEESTEPQVEETSFLAYCWQASPTFFVLMLAISVALVYVLVDLYMKLKADILIPPALIAQLDALLDEKKYREAFEAIKADNASLFARSITAGVERLSHGFDRGVDAMMTVSEDGKLEMEHRLSPVATIATVSPMLGLLGTVLGMIFAFEEIGRGGQPKPEKLAGDIGLALVTTLEGLLVAIPALSFYSFFRNRIGRLTYMLESLGESYLWRFSAALKK